MRIWVGPEVGGHEWDALLRSCPEASCFHTRPWVRALTRVAPDCSPLYILALDDAGRLLGGIPAVRSVRCGLAQLFSLPYGTYGDPLVGPAPESVRSRIRGALLERWKLEATRPGVLRAELVLSPHTRDRGEPLLPPAWRRRCATRIVSLESGFSRLWRDRFAGDKRTAYRRSAALGVTADRPRPAEAARIIDRFYRASCWGWSGHTPLRPGIFEAVVEELGGAAAIWVARLEGEPLAASLVLEWGSRAFSWVTVGAAPARRLRAANLLYTEILRDACRRGLTSLNLGESRGSAGLDAFKAAFGGVEHYYAAYLRETLLFRPLHRIVAGAAGWARRDGQSAYSTERV